MKDCNCHPGDGHSVECQKENNRYTYLCGHYVNSDSKNCLLCGSIRKIHSFTCNIIKDSITFYFDNITYYSTYNNLEEINLMEHFNALGNILYITINNVSKGIHFTVFIKYPEIIPFLNKLDLYKEIVHIQWTGKNFEEVVKFVSKYSDSYKVLTDNNDLFIWRYTDKNNLFSSLIQVPLHYIISCKNKTFYFEKPDKEK